MTDDQREWMQFHAHATAVHKDIIDIVASYMAERRRIDAEMIKREAESLMKFIREGALAMVEDARRGIPMPVIDRNKLT